MSWVWAGDPPLSEEDLRVLRRSLARLSIQDAGRDGALARQLLARLQAATFARQVIGEELGPPQTHPRPELVCLPGGIPWGDGSA